MEIKKNGYEATIKKALEIASKDTDMIYVTICSDVLDASANPQGPVDPCGLTSFELAMMVNECGRAGANAFDFVEIYPETCGTLLYEWSGCKKSRGSTEISSRTPQKIRRKFRRILEFSPYFLW